MAKSLFGPSLTASENTDFGVHGNEERRSPLIAHLNTVGSVPALRR